MIVLAGTTVSPACINAATSSLPTALRSTRYESPSTVACLISAQNPSVAQSICEQRCPVTSARSQPRFHNDKGPTRRQILVADRTATSLERRRDREPERLTRLSQYIVSTIEL
jgi:hypothetical protein